MSAIGKDGRTTIHVFHALTVAEAVKEAMRNVVGLAQEATLVLPSSLDSGDPLVQVIRRELRARAISSAVLIPEHPVRLATGRLLARRTEWQAVPLALPDKPERTVSLPARLLTAGSALYATHVNTVARTGPFQLDLLSRYIHPRDRLRLLADQDRAGLAAEINLAARPAWSVIGCDVSPGIVAVATDLIAAELVALCLAERFFDRRGEFSSPWEDRVVQRATELDLGVSTPHHMRIEVVNGASGTASEEAVAAIAAALRERIGIAARE